MGQLLGTESAPEDKVQRATVIKTFSDLLKVSEINGISLNEIDRRASPGPESWAFSGFLGPDQTFLECLMHDWQTVRALDVTHIDLANGLRKFIAYNEEEMYKWSDRQFDRAELLPTLKGLTPEKQTFRIFFSQTRGFQHSIFENDENPDSDESNHHLDVDIILYNTKLESIGVELHFGANGSNSKSQLDWIERYGFYEGGDCNEYRLDPRFIIATLTGQAPEGEALDVLIRRLEGKLEQPIPALEAKRIEIQLANARGLKTPGYTPKPLPPRE